MTEISATYICSFCLQENEILVDVTAGNHQVFTEDCSMCCSPNVLHITLDAGTGDVSVEAEPEA